jgi:hypothetical protein
MAIKISGSAIIDDDRNIVNAGVVTASSFSGDGSQLTGVGIGSEGSINTTGIITASTISANEFIGTGDKLIFSPTVTSFSPVDGAIDVDLDTNIVLTFDQPIYAGVGSVFLRNSSGIGTIIEEIGIGSTSQITLNNQTLTITPSSLLPTGTDVYVVLPEGVITNVVGGNNALLDTYNFTATDFAFLSVNPTNGGTNVGLDTSIALTFTSPPTRGTGTVELRSGSTSGTIVESFDAASSGQIAVSGNDWILTPSSDLPFSSSLHPIIPTTAIQSYVGLNTTGADSYSFTTRALQLGDAYEGGYLICQSGGTRWVVAPNAAIVSRSWGQRNDANTAAQQVSGCTGWFVPSCGQLKNPGYVCRTYWETPPSYFYWSSTDINGVAAWAINMSNGSDGMPHNSGNYPVVSFRCVSY